MDPALLDALEKWAADDLRSLNGQIEWILRRALVERKRIKYDEEGPREPPVHDRE
ncbi:MAG: hypothetical protein ABSH20_12865 [Tepidisphaeraceae bacterium]